MGAGVQTQAWASEPPVRQAGRLIAKGHHSSRGPSSPAHKALLHGTSCSTVARPSHQLKVSFQLPRNRSQATLSTWRTGHAASSPVPEHPSISQITPLSPQPRQFAQQSRFQSTRCCSHPSLLLQPAQPAVARSLLSTRMSPFAAALLPVCG